MKIVADYVPARCNYLTAGKVYEARLRSDYGGWINDDAGIRIFVHFPRSWHLAGNPWRIIDETKGDAT